MSKSSGDPRWQLALRPLSIARMLWKQKFAIVFVSLLLSAVTIGFVIRLPAVYRAETLILVDFQKIPEKFVSTTVSADLREQLASLSEQILSTSQLWKTIETLDLYKEERRTLSMEEVLERMRSELQVRVEKGWSDERPGAFRVSFQGSNPVLVAKVVTHLGSLFVDENLRTREMHAEETLQFMRNQLAQAKEALDTEEQRISRYKLDHSGELPQQESSLTASLSQLGVQLQGNQEAINRAYANQAGLQSGIRVAETVAEVSQRLKKASSEGQSSLSPNQQPSEQKPEELVKAMEAELAQLLTKFTERHPRVQLLRMTIARIKALEEKERLAEAVDPERTEALKTQLVAVDREIKELNEERQRLLAEIHATQSHLSRMPVREQEMAALTRDYEISKTNYKSLQDKLYAAEMAADMERLQKAERFVILDPARVPQRPIKPNRRALAAIGGLASLAIGLILGLAQEIRKNHILGEWELPPETPVFGRVPSLRGGMRTFAGIRVRKGRRQDSGLSLAKVPNGNGNGSHSVRPLSSEGSPLEEVGVHSPATASAHQSTLLGGVTVHRPVRIVRAESPALCLNNPNMLALEQYRITRTKIEYDRRAPKLVAVTSPCPGDGKTISTINLATVFAMRNDVQILLVEADFRHSCVAELLGIPAHPGLSDVLTNRCELSEAIVCVQQLPNLCVLPAGANAADVTEMFDTPGWRSLCLSFREQFAFTLFDTPPIGPVADYELIEKNCDGVLMVVRPDHTDRSLFRIAHDLSSPGKLMGILANDVEDWFLWRTPASYYQAYLQ